MTRAEIAARRVVKLEEADERRRGEVRKWLAVQSEYSKPFDVRLFEDGILFEVWRNGRPSKTTKFVPWAEIQATVVDLRP
jgi:hypothetical protein